MNFEIEMDLIKFETWSENISTTNWTSFLLFSPTFSSVKRSGEKIVIESLFASAKGIYDIEKCKLTYIIRYKLGVIIGLAFMILMWALFFIGFIFSENVTFNEIENPSLIVRFLASILTTLVAGIPVILLLKTKKLLKDDIVKSTKLKGKVLTRNVKS